MRREVEDRINATAARQHGVITRAQLIDAGLSPSAVGRRLRGGQLHPMQRGVYRLGPIAHARAREMAAVLACGNGAVISHLSAATLWDLLPRVAEAPVDVTMRINCGRRPGVRAHRVSLGVSEQTVSEGIPITTPARTLADIASMVGTRELELATARAEREGLVDRATLSRILAQCDGRPGAPALRAVLETRGGPALTRSEAEAKLLELIRAAGLPPPECNVRLGRYEIDFLWRAEGIAAEVDGFRYHATRPRFEGDRRKDAWLLASGITVIRLSWLQITHESIATAVRLGQALARAS